MWAATYGHAEAVRALVQAGAGAELDATDRNLKTALMLAAENGDSASVRVLVQAGAKLDAPDRNLKTALMLAAENGHAASVSALVQTRPL